MVEGTVNLFGNNLRSLINNSGLTYSAAAEELDISPSYLQQLMRGERNPSFETIKAICARFQISEADLFVSSESTSKKTDPKRTLGDSTFAEFKNALPAISNIPLDILLMLSQQDSIYFESLRRVLEGLSEKKKLNPSKKKTAT